MASEITAQMVKDLRERTLAGFTDCKKALTECDGDMDRATEYLRKKGLAQAAKKSGRIAAAGVVHSYIHAGGKIGVLLEVNCESDFVAKTPQFHEFVKDVAMQVAAMSPRWLVPEEVPPEILAKEREIRLELNKASGKPANVIDKIVEGQIKKWLSEVCLLEQIFVKDSKKDIKTLLAELIAKVGENCKVRRFVRWEVGEGIEVAKKDYAQEVKELAGGGA
jgi:elongation factor Ts